MTKLDQVIASTLLGGRSHGGFHEVSGMALGLLFLGGGQINHCQCSVHKGWTSWLPLLTQLLQHVHASLLSAATVVSFCSQTELLSIPRMCHPSINLMQCQLATSSILKHILFKSHVKYNLFRGALLDYKREAPLLCAHVVPCAHSYCSTYHSALIVCWERNR